MKRKSKIIRWHEGDDLVIYIKGMRPIKLTRPRWQDFEMNYDPWPRGWAKLSCLNITKYKECSK